MQSGQVLAEHRDSALRRTLLSSIALQVVTVLGTFVSLPLVARELDPFEFGVVATITGFNAFVGLADLGIGTALAYKVAESVAKKETDRPHSLVAAGLSLVTASAAGVATIGAVLGLTMPWAELLNAEGMTDRAIGHAIVAAALAIGGSIAGSLGYRLLFATQRGSVATLATAVGTVAGACATVVVTQVAAWPWLIVATTLGVPALTSLITTGVVIRSSRDGILRPHFRSMHRADLSELFRSSRWFWLIAVAGAVGFQADSLIVSAYTTSAIAGVYAVILRLCGLLNQTVLPWALQLGPAFTDAHARGHIAWIKRKVGISSVQVLVVGTAFSVFLVVASPPLVDWWLGDHLRPPLSLLIPAALWVTLILAAEPTFMLLQALGHVRFHAAVAVLMALVNLALSVGLASAWGASGPLWASVIATIACVILPGFFRLLRVLDDLEPRSSA